MIRRIGIWGHYHGKNLGDDIVVATIAENLRRRIPDVELVGYSLDPADTARRHNMPAYALSVGTRAPVARPVEDGPDLCTTRTTAPVAEPSDASSYEPSVPSFRHRLREALASTQNPVGLAVNNWVSAALSVWRMRASLRDLDLLIVAGSGPFFDGWDGAWNHPYNLYRCSQLARTTGTKFVPLSVGGGPVDEPVTQFFLRQSLNSSFYKSYRDPYSAELAKRLGANGPHPLFPDLAFGLHPSVLEEAHTHPLHVPGKEPIIGISTMAYKDPRHMPRGTEAVFGHYRDKIADVTAWVLNEGMTPLLLRSDRGDDPVAYDVVHILRQRGIDTDKVLVPPTETHEDLLGQIAACDVVLGGRFHCHVLPMMLGVPVLGLAYHPKTSDMMAYMGQAEYCLNIDRCDRRQIIAGLEMLLAEQDMVAAKLLRASDRCRDAVWLQYDALVDGSTKELDGSYLPEHE